jgi:hypothetical protein
MASCTARARREEDGAEHEIGEALALPDSLKDGQGGVVLDYRFRRRGKGEKKFPTPEQGETTVTSEMDRVVLLGQQPTRVAVVQAGNLKPGMTGRGPCLIEAPYWSALVLPEWTWEETAPGLRISR